MSPSRRPRACAPPFRQGTRVRDCGADCASANRDDAGARVRRRLNLARCETSCTLSVVSPIRYGSRRRGRCQTRDRRELRTRWTPGRHPPCEGARGARTHAGAPRPHPFGSHGAGELRQGAGAASVTRGGSWHGRAQPASPSRSTVGPLSRGRPVARARRSSATAASEMRPACVKHRPRKRRHARSPPRAAPASSVAKTIGGELVGGIEIVDGQEQLGVQQLDALRRGDTRARAHAGCIEPAGVLLRNLAVALTAISTLCAISSVAAASRSPESATAALGVCNHRLRARQVARRPTRWRSVPTDGGPATRAGGRACRPAWARPASVWHIRGERRHAREAQADRRLVLRCKRPHAAPHRRAVRRPRSGLRPLAAGPHPLPVAHAGRRPAP